MMVLIIIKIKILILWQEALEEKKVTTIGITNKYEQEPAGQSHITKTESIDIKN